jgi:CHAD domain-containing protein
MASKESPTFREFGEKVISERLTKMLSYMRAVRRGEDIEAVHDMRVASRRLRAALDVFRPAFHGQQFNRFEREIKAVTDALGEARDLDVMIEHLESLEGIIPRTQRGGIEQFIEVKRLQRERCQRDVMRSFERLDEKDLVVWFQSIVTGKDDPPDLETSNSDQQKEGME